MKNTWRKNTKRNTHTNRTTWDDQRDIYLRSAVHGTHTVYKRYKKKFRRTGHGPSEKEYIQKKLKRKIRRRGKNTKNLKTLHEQSTESADARRRRRRRRRQRKIQECSCHIRTRTQTNKINCKSHTSYQPNAQTFCSFIFTERFIRCFFVFLSWKYIRMASYKHTPNIRTFGKCLCLEFVKFEREWTATRTTWPK